MVFISPPILFFVIILIAVLVIIFFVDVVKNYISDVTFYDHLQSQNKVDEKGNFLMPMEPCDGYVVSLIYHVDGMNQQEIDDFQKFYEDLSKNSHLQKTRFEILVVVHSADGKFLRTLFDLIQQNSSVLKYVKSRENEILDFIAASCKAKGHIIAKAKYHQKIGPNIMNLKNKPLVIFAQHQLNDKYPLFSESDFNEVGICTKLGFNTAFARLHSTGSGALYELKQLCKHYHVDTQFFKTEEIIDIGITDLITVLFSDIFIDLWYLFGFYKKDKTMKIKND